MRPSYCYALLLLGVGKNTNHIKMYSLQFVSKNKRCSPGIYLTLFFVFASAVFSDIHFQRIFLIQVPVGFPTYLHVQNRSRFSPHKNMWFLFVTEWHCHSPNTLLHPYWLSTKFSHTFLSGLTSANVHVLLQLSDSGSPNHHELSWCAINTVKKIPSFTQYKNTYSKVSFSLLTISSIF